MSFSPPKGIQVFATSRRAPQRSFRPSVSVPRRGFRSLLRGEEGVRTGSCTSFQSPEGDSGLCYQNLTQKRCGRQHRVSVPRRGFRSLLLDGGWVWYEWAEGVSVPRRGFRSLLLRNERNGLGVLPDVSVPRRGFRSLLPGARGW